MKGLRFILTIKNIFADIPKSLTVDGITIPNPNGNLKYFQQLLFFNQLLIERSLIFHFHINILHLFLKIDLMFPFL